MLIDACIGCDKSDNWFAGWYRRIVDAGLADIVSLNYVLNEFARFEPSPVHTPGHVLAHLSSQDSRAVVFGDLMHSPVQCARPEWRFASDWMPDKAQISREQFLRNHADSHALILSGHFPSPSIGHIASADNNYRFTYLEKYE